jgi:hypothetical protein
VKKSRGQDSHHFRVSVNVCPNWSVGQKLCHIMGSERAFPVITIIITMSRDWNYPYESLDEWTCETKRSCLTHFLMNVTDVTLKI